MNNIDVSKILVSEKEKCDKYNKYKIYYIKI